MVCGIGYGDIVPTNIIETTYATIVILFGGIVLPAVVGGLAAYMSNFNITAKLFRKRLMKVRKYLLRIKLSGSVVNKVFQYYDYHWSCQGGVVEQDVMEELTLPLRMQSQSYISGETINLIPFFSRCDQVTKQLIVSALQSRVFIPSDCIIQQGERVTMMFFLRQGRAEVSFSNMKVPLRILSSGDFFGESSLLRSSLSSETVQACTYCECFTLSKEDFTDAIDESPSVDQVKLDIANAETQANLMNKRIICNISDHPKCLRFLSEPLSEKKKSMKSSPSHVFLPESRYLVAWNGFLLCICVYHAWMIPFRLAFMTSSSSKTVDWLFDLFFLLDMVSGSVPVL